MSDIEKPSNPDSNLKDYLVVLFQEKGWDPYDKYVQNPAQAKVNLNIEGHIGLCWMNLFEFCENLAPKDEELIRSTIATIDFGNGDIKHYLGYLMEGMLLSRGFVPL